MESNPSSSEPALQLLEPGIQDDSRPRCTICGKVFKRMYGLERHIVVHDPLRARLEHKCPYEGCKFSSLQKSNVKTHIAAVHEKVKHTCTLPRNADDAFAFGAVHSNRCGRIFSDAPALIRHEKRAHGFYRRGALAKAKVKVRMAEKAPDQLPDIRGSSEDIRKQAVRAASLPEEKVQFWLQANVTRTNAERGRESDNDTPSVTRLELHGSGLNYASASASTFASTSISDAESATTGSASSSFSTPPSPVPEHLNRFFPPVSTFLPAYPPGNYYPYDPSSLHPYNVNRGYSLSPAQYNQTQASDTVHYDDENPPIEEWLPPLAEMKRAMQASAMHGGGLDWDGIVTGLSLVD